MWEGERGLAKQKGPHRSGSRTEQDLESKVEKTGLSQESCLKRVDFKYLDKGTIMENEM